MRPWLAVLIPLAVYAQSDLNDLTRPQHYSAQRVSSANRFVRSNDDSKRIMPGETFVMADLDGPGVVNHIWLTVADNEYAWPRLLRLRVYYDGKKTPSIDVPLGDFFGVGHGYERNLDSMPVRNSSFGRAHNSYWRMPFRKHCRITVTDEGKRPATMFYYHVDWQRHPTLAEDTMYLHAYYRQERPAVMGRHYAFLDTKGEGHYVGTVLNVIQAGIGWFGEGDDLFYIDGAKHPQIIGTGTEDYVNDAWGLRVSYGPWSGTPVAEGELLGARLTGYRWHVPDPVPFTKSIWAGIEHAGWTYNEDGTLRGGFEERPDYFSSVAFWYQKGVNESLPEPPYGDARLPLGNAEQIAVEDAVDQVVCTKGKATVQREVDWGRDLLFFEAREVGARIDIPIDVRADGRYEILARIALAPDYGDYIMLVDGKPANVDNRQAATSEMPSSSAPVFHGYLPEVLVAPDQPVGWLKLAKGRHTLTFECVGKDSRSAGYNLGINDVVLERIPTAPENDPVLTVRATGPVPAGVPVYRGVPLASYVSALTGATESARPAILRAIGAFGTDAAGAASKVGDALSSSSIDTRIAAAWALQQMGPAAAPAASALEKTLADSDSTVRSASAMALRTIGPGAAKASAGLIKALADPMPAVRALAADALGNIGPSAGQPVVDALTRRLEGTTEPVVFALRSVSTALGKIGPSAASALPALEQVIKLHRVSYAAEEAIARIKGGSVEVW